ncbi:MAG: hypothetical protein AB7W59_23770, partial [Acidimicrobiia bacterium]
QPAPTVPPPPATTPTTVLDSGEQVGTTPSTVIAPDRAERMRKHLQRLFQFWMLRHWRFQAQRG